MMDETQPQNRHLQMRVSDQFLRSLDEWRRGQDDLPSRTDAVRRLVKLGIGVQPGRKADGRRGRGV